MLPGKLKRHMNEQVLVCDAWPQIPDYKASTYAYLLFFFFKQVLLVAVVAVTVVVIVLLILVVVIVLQVAAKQKQ